MVSLFSASRKENGEEGGNRMGREGRTEERREKDAGRGWECFDISVDAGLQR